MAEFYLDTIKGEGAGKAFHFESKSVRVGRSDEVELCFDEMGVSWEHAEFRYRDGGYWIVDGGSTNGTYVNDERAHNARLKEGDLIRFGKKGPVVRFKLTKPESVIVPQSSAEHPSAIARRKKRKRLPSEPDIPVPLIPGINAPALGDPNAGYSDLPPAAPKSRSAMNTVLLVVPSLLFCAALIGLGLLSMDSHEQELQLIAAQKEATDIKRKMRDLGTRSQEFEEEALAEERQKVERLERELSRTRRKAEERVDRSQERIERLERELATARNETGRLRRELDSERERARRRARAWTPPKQAPTATTNTGVTSWQQIERRLSPSVVFIATRVRGIDANRRSIELNCFGTGFFISSEGHIVTNKHVLQPWKFRALAERMAREGIEIVESSYKIYAWRGGARFLKRGARGRSDFDLAAGFSTTNNTLKLLRTAPDKWDSVSLGDSSVRMIQVHQSGDADLAILKATGSVGKPIPMGHSDGVQKLDEVLVLGFPAGPSVLEAGIAETSPARGTVRKVEQTIHVSAAMLGGNSGGPLIDSQGKAVGISTMVVRGSETLGSCLRIELATELLHGGSW
jgi:hypothetical protein